MEVAEKDEIRPKQKELVNKFQTEPRDILLQVSGGQRLGAEQTRVSVDRLERHRKPYRHH